MTRFDPPSADEPTTEQSRGRTASVDKGPWPTTRARASRRSILGALGAGALLATTGAGALATGATAQSDDEPIFVRCSHPAIGLEEFPDPIRAELEVALEEGVYESSDRPRIVEVMDVEESAVIADDAWYEATVERVEGGSYELTLEEEDPPTKPSPEPIVASNRSDEERTLSIRVENDGEVVFEDAVVLDPGQQRVVLELAEIGTYDVVVETDDGQTGDARMTVDRWGWSLFVDVQSDGALMVSQEVPNPPGPCRFEASFEADRYERCNRFVIRYDVFPAPVRDELDAALADGGTHVFADPPLLLQTMNVHDSYVAVDGTYYSAAVTAVEGGYELELEEPVALTVRRPRQLTLRNRSDETRTFAVRLAKDGETLREETVEVPPGETTSLFGVYVVGTYDLTVETDGEVAEWDWNVGGSGSDASASLYPDGTLHLSQAVADPARCPFDTGPTIDLNGYEPRPYEGSERYLDVDGTGTLGSNDVVAFFEHVEDDAVQTHPEYFDFNGSGGVGFDDVVALFEQI